MGISQSTLSRIVRGGVLAAAVSVGNAARSADQPAGPDWPQWRGPTRNGTAPAGGPALPVTWPAKGPVKLWQSDKIPTYNDGGLGSVSVAGGLAVVYSNWKYQDPIATRTLADDGLRRLGWLPELPPKEVLDAIEAARTSEERTKLAGKDVNKWVDSWFAANFKDEALRKKFGDWPKDRLRRGAAAVELPMLEKLATIKGKAFATQAELDAWLAEAKIEGKLRDEVVKAIPTTRELAHDVVFAFDTATGAVKWQAKLEGEPRGWDNSATPTIDGERCYILGSGSNLYCLSMKDGTVIWKGKALAGGGSSSVLVHNGLAILVAGNLSAFKVENGELAWKQPAVGHSHTSPVLWTKDGKSYILCGAGGELALCDPADGKLLWEVAPGCNNSTPVIGGDIAVVQGEGPGLTAYRLSPEKAEKLWNLPYNDRGSSPLICNGYVYITSGGGQAKAMCLKLDNGEIFWAQKLPGQEISSPILADGKILTFMGGAREMWMIQATPEKYTFLAKGTVEAANCSSPAIVGTRLYLRTNQGVACFDLAAVPPPPPPAPGAPADAKAAVPPAK